MEEQATPQPMQQIGMVLPLTSRPISDINNMDTGWQEGHPACTHISAATKCNLVYQYYQ